MLNKIKSSIKTKYLPNKIRMTSLNSVNLKIQINTKKHE
jgi:hypothetical protein